MHQDQQHQYRSMNTSQNRPPKNTDENQPRHGPSMITSLQHNQSFKNINLNYLAIMITETKSLIKTVKLDIQMIL